MSRAAMRDRTASPTDRRTRVLVLTPWYPTPDQPVWGLFVQEHTKAVAPFAEAAVLHAPGASRNAGPLWTLAEESDERLTCGFPTWRLRTRILPVRALTLAVQLYAICRAVLRIRATGFDPDVLHAHTFDAGFAAVLAGWLLRVPLVITEHYSAFPLGTLSRRERARARFAFRRARAVLPVSDALKAAIERQGMRGNFEVVSNAVDTAIFRPGQAPASDREPHRFLFVGRLDPVKQLPVLLRALVPLRDHPREWSLEIVGEGPERRACEQEATVLGIADRLHFRGALSRAGVAEAMGRSHVLVLPSRWENAPCVIIEAFACGLPVIASAVGGIPELVSRETGELVKAGSETELTGALQRSLERGIVPREPLLERARQHGLDAVGRRIHDIYMRVITC